MLIYLEDILTREDQVGFFVELATGHEGHCFLAFLQLHQVHDGLALGGGVALGQLDPVTLIDLFFACMTDEELTEILVGEGDSELGVSKDSLSCLIGGLLAEEPTRRALRQNVMEDKNFRDTIGSLSADPAIAGKVDVLVNTCFTDEEQASLLGI